MAYDCQATDATQVAIQNGVHGGKPLWILPLARLHILLLASCDMTSQRFKHCHDSMLCILWSSLRYISRFEKGLDLAAAAAAAAAVARSALGAGTSL